jgi:hypothetical protein
MKKNNFIIFGIIIIIILFFLITQNKENFEYCSNCDKKTPIDCFNCTNCGICIDRLGDRYCESGDSNGPYNRSDCLYWLNGWRNPKVYYL